MRLFSILAALALCPSATGQVSLSFATNPANYVRVPGGKFFVGSQQVSSRTSTLSTQTILRSQLLVFPGSLVLGGSGNDIPIDAKLDSTGNVYVGGDTDELDFPTTPGVIRSAGPASDFFGAVFSYSFLTKISSAGKLVYSTLVTTGIADCFGGSGCIGRNSTYANIPSLAVDSSGNMTVAGSHLGQSSNAAAIGISLDNAGNPYLVCNSSSSNFPILSGVPDLGSNFVLSLNSTGSQPQDGTMNSSTNPAATDSIISLFGTGETNFLGTLAASSQYLNILYFGPALGLPGVFQANVRLSASASGPIVLQTAAMNSGELNSNPVTVYVGSLK